MAGGPFHDKLLTPSKITAWLDCEHYLTLQHEVEGGVRTIERSPFGELAQLLLAKGLEHEQQVLERYRTAGKSVLVVPDRNKHESFAAWVARIGNPLDGSHDVVFQMPFVHDGVRGIADFLERVDDSEGATFTYEPVDAKLARGSAKPGHVLQLCFYAEAIEALTGLHPERMHIELGSGIRETVRTADVAAYWRRLRRQLIKVFAADANIETTPDRCDHCGFCEFQIACEAEWRASDSLLFVADIRRTDRETLVAGHVDTMAALAELTEPVGEFDQQRHEKFVRQAGLQVQAREAEQDAPPPFIVLDIAPLEIGAALEGDPPDEAEAIGFAAMPAPDDGDVFLDFEGHPFWRADAELFFLFGLIHQVLPDEWEFKAFWAHDLDEEAVATAALIDYLAERRTRFPNMHVYHYNHTERSSLERLTIKHGVAELKLEQLVVTGVFVDLLPIVKGAMQVGVESYGLKHIERLTDYERGHDIDQGAGAVVEYEKSMTATDPNDRADYLARISSYNEDDVRATRALRDWLVSQRPAGLPWRTPTFDTYEPDEELDARIEQLHAFGPGTPEHLMGDLLGYWRREKSAVAADAYRLAIADESEQLDSMVSIARLTFKGTEPQFSAKTGKQLKWPAAVFSFPTQPVDADIKAGSKLITAVSEQEWAFFTVVSVDRDVCELRLAWNDDDMDGPLPTSLVQFKWFDERAKLDALQVLADEMLSGESDPVAHALLRRDPVRFLPVGGPAAGRFEADLDDILEWSTQLDRSFVPIQGPPGTGKTFTGAHLVHALVKANKRVALTAMSHHAIDNLMEAVVDRFEEDGDIGLLRAARKAKSGSVRHVDYVDDNRKCAEGDFNVIAGTPWLCASTAMRDNPVDVLIVDEAGQLGLADTLAASISATNVILLGDPQQLPQVSQATHPGGAGVSALEHLLGDEVTVSPERGVLLDVTRRMHPHVCDFISEVMYDGMLTSHASCEGQTTAAGTGLRWIKAVHNGCSTESAVEAGMVVAKIEELLGSDWMNQYGVVKSLTAADFIVVTPYNDQRRCIEKALAVSPTTAGVQVGTVDKFQGREAAVVLFSMATSSSESMPRTADFLFSKNRLNVAISRARCLAYLICTDKLLDTRARDVDQMELISALCSFVESASYAGPTPWMINPREQWLQASSERAGPD